MHLRCPCTAAMATADPPAPTEHIGSERAHARGLPAVLQLCSPSMSRPAQIKDQLELDDDSRLKNGGYSCTRTCGGRATVSADQLDQCARAARCNWSFASVDPIIRTPYTPTRVPKPRAATGNDSTPPHDPAPFPPSLYYQTTVAETACSHVSCVNDTARNIVRVAESKQSAEPLTTGRPTHPTRSPSAMGGS